MSHSTQLLPCSHKIALLAEVIVTTITSHATICLTVVYIFTTMLTSSALPTITVDFTFTFFATTTNLY